MASTIFKLRLKKRLAPDAPVLGQLGNLETRLARSRSEIREAQAVRYQVFYEEMNARPDKRSQARRRDKDRYDAFCDHLLVIDHSGREPRIVGTYRLLTGQQARRAGGFYSSNEFDLSQLMNHHGKGRMLELGRSCILPAYRSMRTMELLWQGVWSYVLENRIDVLFGCASFEGTDVKTHSAPLEYLANHALLPTQEHCSPASGSAGPAADAGHFDITGLDTSSKSDGRAIASLPPLLKGYIRLGAKVSPYAVIDHNFQTTDVLVVLKIADIAPRYLAHYGIDASRFAA